MSIKNAVNAEAKYRELAAREQADVDYWESHGGEPDGPSEPDYESIMQSRWEDSFDEDAAQDRVDNAIYDPPGL